MLLHDCVVVMQLLNAIYDTMVHNSGFQTFIDTTKNKRTTVEQTVPWHQLIASWPQRLVNEDVADLSARCEMPASAASCAC